MASSRKSTPAEAFRGAGHVFLATAGHGGRRARKGALSIQEKILHPEHPELANTLNNLAVLLKTQATWRRPESCTAGRYDPREGRWPGKPRGGLESAHARRAAGCRGRSGRRRTLCRRSPSIREKAFGPDHLM
jgi:hypothetical protein